MVGARWTCAVEDRERDVQHTQKPRLPIRTQLWTWAPAPIGGLRDAHDVDLPGRSSPANLLPVVSGGLAEVGDQACFMGQSAVPLPTFHFSIDEASLRGDPFWFWQGRRPCLRYVIVQLPCIPSRDGKIALIFHLLSILGAGRVCHA